MNAAVVAIEVVRRPQLKSREPDSWELHLIPFDRCWLHVHALPQQEMQVHLDAGMTKVVVRGQALMIPIVSKMTVQLRKKGCQERQDPHL